MLDTDVPYCWPLRSDAGANLLHLQLSHGDVRFILQLNHLLAFKSVSCSSFRAKKTNTVLTFTYISNKVTVDLFQTGRRSVSQSQQVNGCEQHVYLSPMNIDMAPQDGQVTEVDTTSDDSFSCVSLIRSRGLSTSSVIPCKCRTIKSPHCSGGRGPIFG